MEDTPSMQPGQSFKCLALERVAPTDDGYLFRVLMAVVGIVSSCRSTALATTC